MQPSKKIKTEVSQTKPLIADKPLKTKKNQEVDSDNEEQTTQQPQVSEEVKVSQLARNREIEKDVYGFDVKKSQNWINKQRTLVFCSRGISVQGRFLMLDLINLLPHCKKEVILSIRKVIYMYRIKSKRSKSKNKSMNSAHSHLAIMSSTLSAEKNVICTSGCPNSPMAPPPNSTSKISTQLKNSV